MKRIRIKRRMKRNKTKRRRKKKKKNKRTLVSNFYYSTILVFCFEKANKDIYFTKEQLEWYEKNYIPF